MMSSFDYWCHMNWRHYTNLLKSVSEDLKVKILDFKLVNTVQMS